ncbi:MAG: LamG domain-containing protein [Gammaproteobacteria bacterium]|jgi:hypothetical protein
MPTKSKTGALLYAGLLLLGPLAAFAGDIEVRIVRAVTDYYVMPEDQPRPGTESGYFDVTLTPGEYEPLSFVVYAAAQADNLRIQTAPVSGPDEKLLEGASVDVRVVKRWYQQNRGGYSDTRNPELRYLTPELLLYDDELVRAEDGENALRMVSGEYRTISKPGKRKKSVIYRPDEFPVRDAADLKPVSIAAGTNRQFWVTVYIPPGAPAGRYKSMISVFKGDAVIASLPLDIEVLPFMLAESLVTYSMYYRGYLDSDRPDGSVSSEVKSKAQMLADFQNMRTHGVTNPNIYQKIGSRQLSDVLALRDEAGLDNSEIYYLGVTIVANNNGIVAQRLADEVATSIETAKQFGVEPVYFFARDEARGEELEYQFPFWDVVKAQGGKIFAAGWQTDARRPGNFDVTGGREDLFVSLGMVRKEEAARWHGKGKRIFSYQNPTGGRELPETWRRNYGLLLWQNDYDGAMPYAWQHSFGDGWNDFDHRRHQDLNFTYASLDGPIETIQWEGFREAVDDMRYLSTLIELLDSADPDDPRVSATRNWVDSLRTIALSPRDLDELRGEMIARILLLKGFEPSAEPKGGIAGMSHSPIDSGGRTEVRWQTAERMTTRLEFLDATALNISDSPGFRRRHVVSVDGLQPGKRYSYKAASAALSGAGVIDTSPGIDITTVSEQNAGQLTLALNVDSNYRASVAVDLNNSLLGWWRFPAGDVGEDLSGNKADAQLKGDAVPGAGRFGGGVTLDGDGSFINMPDIDIGENGTATVEGWFRFKSFAMDNLSNMGIFSGVYQHASNNHFYFARTNESFEVAGALQRDTWHHIALTWDGDTSGAVLYVDGQPVRVNVQKQIEPILAVDGLTVGRSGGYFGGLVGAASNTFDGDVDEIRAWNRVLSAEEIMASYAASKSRLQFSYPVPKGSKPQWKVLGANAADEVFAR